MDLEASQAQQVQPGAKPRRNPMEDLKREIMIMKKMKHSNIVMLSEVRGRSSRGVELPGGQSSSHSCRNRLYSLVPGAEVARARRNGNGVGA